MGKVIITIGISGQGKSTHVKTMYPEAHYLNADRIRGELSGGNESDQSRNQEVFALLYERFSRALVGNQDIVVDNTSLTFKDRNKFYTLINEFCRDTDTVSPKITLVYCVPDLELAIKRNSLRERQVPPEIITRQFSRIQEPTRWEVESPHITIERVIL